MAYTRNRNGIFTPTVTLVGGTGNVVPQYSTNVGTFQLIGNRVRVGVHLIGDAGDEGDGSGQINIALPVTANADQIPGPFICGVSQNNTNQFVLFGNIMPSGETILLQYLNTIPPSGAAFADLIGSDQNNADRYIRLLFDYTV